MTTPTLPGPWAIDEAPGPTRHLGSTRVPAASPPAGSSPAASCSLVPANGACDAHRALVADNARLRAELAALVQVAAKLREDLDRLSGQALDLGRDTGRVHRALDEAQVPKANPEPGRPWRIDDRVAWALERLKTTGELVDNLEEQLAQAGAELADVKHQLQRLQLSACRLVAVNGGRA